METNLLRIKRDIEELSNFNATPGNGLTRFTYTEEHRGAADYIKNEMKRIGLHVYEDSVGNVIGRLDGELKEQPKVMLGSHFDSVRNGGNFDGPAGVVTALEVARVIKENNIKTNFPIEFVAMVEEEGGRFGSGLFGSRAMVGKLTEEQLEAYSDEKGISIGKAMREFGLDPHKVKGTMRDREELKAFIELHIEQGPILEKGNKDVGLVEYIVGIKNFRVIVKGRPDHAGTTPMNMRSDALDAASNVISNISKYAKEAGEGTVATVGELKVLPGATNIVPGKVEFMVDIRSKKWSCIENVSNKIIDKLEEVASDKDVTYEIIEKLGVKPVELDASILQAFKNNSKNLGFAEEMMLSGAGHDAMVMAELTNVGLVFVPSKDGRSHCPEEWTDYEDLQKGIELVYKTILDIAQVAD